MTMLGVPDLLLKIKVKMSKKVNKNTFKKKNINKKFGLVWLENRF